MYLWFFHLHLCVSVCVRVSMCMRGCVCMCVSVCMLALEIIFRDPIREAFVCGWVRSITRRDARPAIFCLDNFGWVMVHSDKYIYTVYLRNNRTFLYNLFVVRKMKLRNLDSNAHKRSNSMNLALMRSHEFFSFGVFHFPDSNLPIQSYILEGKNAFQLHIKLLIVSEIWLWTFKKLEVNNENSSSWQQRRWCWSAVSVILFDATERQHPVYLRALTRVLVAKIHTH